MKRSCGASWLSRIAPTGHEPTQARHIVQVSRLTSIGAERRAGRQRDLALRHRRVRARDARSRAPPSCACRRSARTSPATRTAERGRPRPRAPRRSASASAPSNTRKCCALVAQRLRDRRRRCASAARAPRGTAAPRRRSRARRPAIAPCASAASQTSSPTEATWCTSSGITRAGSPRPRRARRAIASRPSSACSRRHASRPPAFA